MNSKGVKCFFAYFYQGLYTPIVNSECIKCRECGDVVAQRTSVAEPEPSEPGFFGLAGAGAGARTFWSGSGSDLMGF